MNVRTSALLLASATLFGSCGGGNRTPTPVTPSIPTPRPVPTPIIDAGCNLPKLPDLRNFCPRLDDPKFGGVVDSAIKRVFKEQPELFDFTRRKGGGVYSYKVLDRRGYTGAVVKNIQAQGVCAEDQKEEIAVKDSQEFNEQYNVWTSDGYVRLPPGAYESTCFPAQF
jgi:hypothetical protein